ncbi:MAG: DNA methyltransferase [Saprospiraceae bacterium]|nr:DNA methyltransferase [Saprospiraceae bacterium]MDW8229044.1 DNA methyltransferase [Saprospiraceae bacterium]
MEKTTHRIIRGDSRWMRELEDDSVHLVITSPPYWQLKDYGAEGQIGFHDDYETYVNHLNLVWSECFRVLKPGCRLCVNIGDQFARAVYYGRYKVIPIHSEIIRFCETAGFDFMGSIIWQKTTTTNTTGGASVMGSFPYPRNGVVKLDFEYILLFKKPGEAPKPTPEQKAQAAMTTEEWNTYFHGHWNIPGIRQEGHLAMFPEEIPRRLIRMFSFPGEWILDPFLGSGTTSLAALKLGRNSCGYEINPAFIPIIRKKLTAHERSLFAEAAFCFEEQRPLDIPFAEEIARLPYVFRDPHRLDKQVDVKKRTFGSRIDAESDHPRETLFTVRDVLSPERVRLSNGDTVRLIGIQADPARLNDAVDFLRQKTKGKRVFLRLDDDVQRDEQQTPMVYLYLENKTFLNAHLLKQGLARVDNSRAYRYQQKFNELAKNG